MAAPSLSALPARFNAGNTVKYTRRHSDYPASAGWGLALHISGLATFSAAGTPVGDAFDVAITAAKTANVTVTGCTVTAAGVVTRGAGNFTTDGVLPGYLAHGPGIPRGAFVKTVDSATVVTLSEPCTAGASLSLLFRFPPGVYAWREVVTLAAEVYTAAEGTVSIDPDINGAPAGSLQTWEQEMLPVVEDIIAGKVATDTASYQIADRAKTALNFRDMLSFLGYLRAAVRGQANPGALEKAYPVFGPRG
jgi:hypothetical protein